MSAATTRCGFLRTGETLAGQLVRLRITRLQARPDRLGRHPVVFVPGGPADPAGQAPADLRGWQQFQQAAGWPRDLVLYDPRGTGASTPRVRCPTSKIDDADALARCYKAVGARTAHALGLEAQVEDLHRLIQALGQGGAVLWAQSFGAVVAQRLATRYPRDVSALLLDSPVLNTEPIGRRTRKAMQRVVDQLVLFCRDAPACRARPISAESLITGWLKRLNDQPLVLRRAVVPRRPGAVRLDAQGLLAALLLSSYHTDGYSQTITRLRQGLHAPAALWALVAPLVALDSQTPDRTPAYWSARCGLPRSATADESPDPSLADSPDISSYLPARSDPCRKWPMPAVSHVPQSTDPGGLIVAGTDDVLVAFTMVRAYVAAHRGFRLVPIRGGGHGSLRRNRCALKVVAAWLRGRHDVQEQRLRAVVCAQSEQAAYDARSLGR